MAPTAIADAAAVVAAPAGGGASPSLGAGALPSDPPGERSVASPVKAASSDGAPAPSHPQSPPAPAAPPAPSTPASPSSSLRLGGPNGTNGVPAYALLAGLLEPTGEVVAVPITRLPTTLGKQHETRDGSFVGLREPPGEEKLKAKDKLSKSACVIFYRDKSGGKLGCYKKSKRKKEGEGGEGGEMAVEAGGADLNGMIYKPYVVDAGDEDDEKKSSSTPAPDDILRPSNVDEKAPLPPNGFFAIECTCRSITVGGRALKKGQSAVLENGTPIRVASYCFYFLLPKSTSSSSLPKSPPTLRIRMPSPMKVKMEGSPEKEAEASPVKETAKAVAKATPLKATSMEAPEMTAGEAKAGETKAAKKKKKKAAGGGDETKEAATTDAPPKKKAKKSTKDIESALDAQSDAQLLALLSQKARDDGPWDKECQLLGAALAVRACTAASQSPTIRRIAREEGGVTQRDVMEWMNGPGCAFRELEGSMLRKIERKSFAMNVGKAIVRAGYVKNESKSLAGRAHRWLLPGSAAEVASAAAGVPAGAPPSGGGAAGRPGAKEAKGAVASAATATEEGKLTVAPAPAPAAAAAAAGGIEKTDVAGAILGAPPGEEKAEAP